MGDWSETLRKALAEQDSGLGEIVGICHGQSGPDFEKAIGDFLTWQRSLELSARYLPLGIESPWDFNIDEWRQRAVWKSATVVTTLTRTLFAQFGQDRVSAVAATSAYGQLFDALDRVGGGSTVIATTNYDPAVELALAELRLKPMLGEVLGPGGATFLDPENLVSMCRTGQSTPVLHLHGKVGWYTQPDGSVQIHSAFHPYNETAGTPTVLWPDPDKDPTVEPGIQKLWEQFELALGQATHLLVIGHSLHDPLLVDRIRRHAGRARKAVAVFAPEDSEMARTTIPEAIEVGIDFGPNPALEHIKQWAGKQ